MAELPTRWGNGLSIDVIAPSVAGQEWARAWRGRVQTHACTPAAAEAFMRMAFDIDVRHVAPTINVPTLVIHAVEDEVCHVENARFLAREIPGARYVGVDMAAGKGVDVVADLQAVGAVLAVLGQQLHEGHSLPTSG